MKKLALTGFALLILHFCLAARDRNPTVLEAEDTLSAEFHDDHIDLSDGRTLEFEIANLPHIGAQVVMTAPTGAAVRIEYADGKDPFVSEVPFVYKVPVSRVNEAFRLVVDEGGPALTWRLDLRHESSYSLEISSDEE